MNFKEFLEVKDPEKIVKCGCGLPMRQKDWADHWRSCPIASGTGKISPEDIAGLEASERQKAMRDEEHRKWMIAQGYIKPLPPQSP